MTKFFAVPLFALILSACAAVTPQTPEQAVFAATSAYNGALGAAVTYESLPRCSDTVPLPCSETDVVDAIRKADSAAWAALELAQNTVRNPNISAAIKDLSLENALNAVAAFTNILSDLEVL